MSDLFTFIWLLVLYLALATVWYIIAGAIFAALTTKEKPTPPEKGKDE